MSSLVFLPGSSAQPSLTALTVFTFVTDRDPRPPLVSSDVSLLTPCLVSALRRGRSTCPESQWRRWGPQAVGAAVTEHHRPGSSQTISFSQFWRLRSPRSRCRQSQCLVRVLLQVLDEQLLNFPLCHMTHKITNRVCRGSALTTSSTSDHLPKAPRPPTLAMGEGFRQMNVEGTQTFSP